MDLPPPEAAPAPPPAPRRVSRRGVYIPIGLLALVILGWSGAWLFARSKAGEVMDAWIAREARLGRVWTCPDRAIGGFPFRIDVSCVRPTFVSTQAGREGRGSLAGLAVTARVLDPTQIIAVFAAPLSFAATAGEEVELAFSGARASYRGTPSAIEQTSLEADSISASVRAPGYEPLTVGVDRVEAHLRRAPDAPAGTDIAVTARGVRAPVLDTLLNDSAPGSVELRARLTQFAPAPPRDWRETLETWRRSDGEARFERLNLAKGAIALNLAGVLRLDEMRRPEGEISGTAAGAGQLLRMFGIEMGGGGLLGALLGGARSGNAAPKALPFSLRMDQGRLFIGPIPGPRLRPLYGPG